MTARAFLADADLRPVALPPGTPFQLVGLALLAPDSPTQSDTKERRRECHGQPNVTVHTFMLSGINA